MTTGNKRPSLGGEKLARCADSHAEIAEKVGVDKSLVTRWISGARRPTTKAQRPRLKELYGIPTEDWDEPATATAAAAVAAPVTPVTSVRVDELSDAERLRRFIGDGMRELETSDLSANKRAAALKKLVDAKVALDRSTGENALTLQRIVAHPEFQRVVRLIVDAIAPYPDALKAALTVLEAQRGGG